MTTTTTITRITDVIVAADTDSSEVVEKESVLLLNDAGAQIRSDMAERHGAHVQCTRDTLYSRTFPIALSLCT